MPALPADLYSLATQDSWDVAIRSSYYKYEEPNIDMSLDGYTFGGEVRKTVTINGVGWLRGEVNGWSAPSLDYNGHYLSGNAPLTGEKSDYKLEARVTFGGDIQPAPVLAPGVLLAPYVGYGFRYLHDDAGSYDSPAAGYSRENQLHYLMAGADARWHLTPNLPVEWRNELETVLTGTQTSHLEDTGLSGYRETKNKQTDGWGYRTHLALLNKVADVGVYYEHWRLDDSDTNNGLYEPANRTHEIGLFLRHRF